MKLDFQELQEAIDRAENATGTIPISSTLIEIQRVDDTTGWIDQATIDYWSERLTRLADDEESDGITWGAAFDGFEDQEWSADTKLRLLTVFLEERTLLGSSVAATPRSFVVYLEERLTRLVDDQESDGDRYQVIVGNVGTVLETNNEREAKLCFNSYVDRSETSDGRCAGEPVTLISGDSILSEHSGD